MEEKIITPEVVDETVRNLRSQLAFQRKWQRISSVAYVVSTLTILMASSGATLAASANWSVVAAYLAALATILVGFEKSMLFREKWKFHLGIATRFMVLDNKLSAKIIPKEKFVEEYTAILQNYADGLPIANRENA